MESSRSRNGIGAGRAGAVAAIVTGLVALPPAFAGEDTSAQAPPPDVGGIVGIGNPDGENANAGRADASKPCPNADAGAEQLTNEQIARAILCLVNQERKSRQRDKVGRNGDLDKAARRHSVKMEAQNCFQHRCSGEPGLDRRVRRSGYTDGAERWRHAENLGCAKTARAMIGDTDPMTQPSGWLGDDFNRRNLLKRRYEDAGVGIVHGSPVTTEPVNCPESAETATYTLLLAFRRG